MSSALPVIIADNQSLRQSYNDLKRGDIVVGRIRLRDSEEHLLTDLTERGVCLIPGAVAQLASRSKVFQSGIFSAWLPPATSPIHDDHQLLEAITSFPHKNDPVITKQDRKNAGMGVHLWRSLEDVYAHATLGNLPYPFVLQPFFDRARDIRVLLIGDYVEAYWRDNSGNFRNNLHCGGVSSPCTLDESQIEMCRQVMKRGGFPYAHVDLLVTEHGTTYVMEINLRGGIKGAVISPEEYKQRVKEVENNLLQQALAKLSE